MLVTCFWAVLALPLQVVCTPDYSMWPDSFNAQDLTLCISNAPHGDCLTADAGDNAVHAAGTIALDGTQTTASHSSAAISYQWSQVENGAPLVTLTGADTASPTFVASVDGSYIFQLEVTWFCRTELDTVTITVSAVAPSAVNAELVATGFNATVVQVTYAFTGDDRLFFVCKSGLIRIYKNGALLPTPFLDISSLASGSGSANSEQGLLGVAFDPDYINNGIFYVNYTGVAPNGTGDSRDTRIVAFQRDATDPDLADPTANALLMTIDQPETNHNGGQLLFGPDGFLYIGTGDGGGANDNHGTIGNGQDPLTLLGKILRVEVNGFNPITIPPDNPFVGDPDTLDEIWALGLRNPWRFSFDRLTGDLYIGDVGQGSWEEIDFQPATSMGGENYGWRLKEGDHCFIPSTNCDPGGLTDPIHEYSHGGNPFRCSVTGGFVYRGSNIPLMEGYYLYGDYCSGGYYTLIEDQGMWENRSLEVFVNDVPLNSADDITAFGEDSGGELYICTQRSSVISVYRIISVRN